MTSVRQTPRGPALVCPGCGTYHRLANAPGRIACRCGAALETMRLLDRPADTRNRWYIDPVSGEAIKL